jgi:hypothetical protein
MPELHQPTIVLTDGRQERSCVSHLCADVASANDRIGSPSPHQRCGVEAREERIGSGIEVDELDVARQDSRRVDVRGTVTVA